MDERILVTHSFMPELEKYYEASIYFNKNGFFYWNNLFRSNHPILLRSIFIKKVAEQFSDTSKVLEIFLKFMRKKEMEGTTI